MSRSRCFILFMHGNKLKWTREPKQYSINDDRIEIVTQPHTDLWQRTYYHFRNDNAPVLQIETDDNYFSFIVKTDFTDSHHRFDQCGIVMYLDSENWLKASVEYENEEFQHLGSVVTNHGCSDWATTAISATVKTMWYRFSRREDDYCIECSYNGVNNTYPTISQQAGINDIMTAGLPTFFRSDKFSESPAFISMMIRAICRSSDEMPSTELSSRSRTYGLTTIPTPSIPMIRGKPSFSKIAAADSPTRKMIASDNNIKHLRI